MFHQVSRFVSRFRDLEQQEFLHTPEEERQWRALKDKLIAPHSIEEQPYSFGRSCVAVASLYPQAGASFIAANVAYAWAGKGIPVTLSEMPNAISYYYFALDYERRVHRLANPSTPAPLLLMQNNHLRIQIDPPLLQNESFHIDQAHWLLRTCKATPFVVIDVSSRWREEGTAQLFELADEIWIVFDADLARLTRLLLVEPPPSWWFTERKKIKLIANKWNDGLSRSRVMKKIEGTFSLWGPESGPVKVEHTLSLIDSEKAGEAQAKANLLLEQFPEEEHEFQSLIHTYKGRLL